MYLTLWTGKQIIFLRNVNIFQPGEFDIIFVSPQFMSNKFVIRRGEGTKNIMQELNFILSWGIHLE